MVLLLHESGDRILGARHVTDGLLQHHHHDLIEFRILGGRSANAPASAHVIERALHEQQGTGDIHERIFIRLIFSGDDVTGELGLLQDSLAWCAHTQHAQGITKGFEGLRHRLQRIQLFTATTLEQVETILDANKVFLDRHGHGLQQIQVMAGQAFLRRRHFVVIGQQAMQLIGRLNSLDARATAVCMGDIEQQVLLQIGGQLNLEGPLTTIDEFLELSIDLPHEQLGGQACFQRTLAQGIHQATSQPPQAGGGITSAGMLQCLQHRTDLLQCIRGILLPVPGQQADLVLVAQGFRQLLHILAGIGPHIIRDGAGQIRREHRILGQQVFTAHRAQVIQ